MLCPRFGVGLGLPGSAVLPAQRCAWAVLFVGLAAAWLTAGEPRPAAAPAAPEAGLRYAWDIGMVYRCQFTLAATIGNEKPAIRGSVAYIPVKVDPKTIGGEEEEGDGSGTAFVISPDGLLVTCAHVVQGALDSQVFLGSQKYTAKVLAYEPEKDLAIMRIEARGLSALGAANGDSVAIGQDVRAVGFPLSDVLGESVKVTRGTIAGIIEKKDGRLFQVDAAINPGNSGGPLVDTKGCVVGVTSARLQGQSIERIGFAIPADAVAALLQQHNLPWQPPSTAGELSGPDLARQVTPAVALLKVRCGPGGVGTATQRVVRYSAGYSEDHLHTPGSPFRLPAGPKAENGSMLVDSLGRVALCRDSLQLPLLLQTVARVGLERLPADRRQQWSMSRAIVLFESDEVGGLSSRALYPTGPRDLPPSRRVPPGYRPRSPGLPPSYRDAPSQVKVRVIPAIEEIRYELGETSAEGLVTIRKEYELTTLHAKDEPALLEIKGHGTIVWDKEQGLPQRSEFQGEAKTANKNVTVRVPFVLTYQFDRKEVSATQDAGAVAESSHPAENRDPVRKVATPAPNPPASTPGKRTESKIPVSSGGLDQFKPDE